MKHIKCIRLMLIVSLLIIGCSGNNVKIRKQSPTDNKMTLAELRENWKDYHIYYGTKGSQRPAGIMFDPKNDNSRLVGDSWIKMKDQQTLSETIRIIETIWGDGKVLIIEGPEPESLFFGYMYLITLSRPGTIFVELVDEQTLYVGSLPWPD